MTVRSFDSGSPGGRGAPTLLGPTAHRARKRPLRQRLVVAANRTADVVRYTGGWLFDKGMAGWDVMALAADDADDRPLRILGVRPGSLEAALASPADGPRPHIFVVDGALYEADPRVRRLAGKMLSNGLTEVRLCGLGGPDAIDDEIGWMVHRPSVAARAFKRQALAVAAEPPLPPDDDEIFQSGESLYSALGSPDLLPA